MAKRTNQKPKLLYLSKILLECTDEAHGLTLSQIIGELKKYGVSAERKSLYDDMEALRVFGINVLTKRDRYVRYYVAGGERLANAKIMSDALAANTDMGDTQRGALLQKLFGACTLHSVGAVELFEDKRVMGEQNDNSYQKLVTVCKAITENKKIKFKYFEWNSHKQRILLDGGAFFTLSPSKLVLKEDGYSVLGYDDTARTVREYQLSSLLLLSVLDAPREGLDKTEEYSTDTRTEQNIRLRCDNSLAGEVFRHFGLSVSVLANRDEYFEVSLKTAADDTFFAWLFLQGNSASVISPENVVNEYTERIKTIFTCLSENK